MLGYILAFVALLIVAAILFPLFATRRAPKPQGGTLESDHPVSRSEPASDEANPAASVTATEAQKEKAGRHTPPS
jgi:hypothetical protein